VSFARDSSIDAISTGKLDPRERAIRSSAVQNSCSKAKDVLWPAIRMDRFSSEPAFDPALVVIPLVPLKVPSCGIVFCLRLLLLCLRSSERNAVRLSLVFDGCTLSCFARAPQIDHISHESDLYFDPTLAKLSSTETA